MRLKQSTGFVNGKYRSGWTCAQTAHREAEGVYLALRPVARQPTGMAHRLRDADARTSVVQ